VATGEDALKLPKFVQTVHFESQQRGATIMSVASQLATQRQAGMSMVARV